MRTRLFPLFPCGHLALYALMACSEAADPARDIHVQDAGIDTAPTARPATVGLSELAVFQAVKVPLMQDGVAVKRFAPIVAGRAAVFRAYVRTQGLPKETFRGQWQLRNSDPSIVDRVYSADCKVTSSSTDGKYTSTFNFEVPADAISEGDTYSFRATGDAKTELEFPVTGTATLDAIAGQVVKVRIVPVYYAPEAVGSQPFIPRVSASDIADYTAVIQDLYPVARADISVRATPLNWTRTVAARGDGWNDLVDAIGLERQNDHVADDVFYMGLVTPALSFDAYCGVGCLAGLAPSIPGTVIPSMQFALSLGFGGDESGRTMAHELGHDFGRAHSPCGGAALPDPKFPYAGGAIGSWGYSLSKKEFYGPEDALDFMAYCSPSWISDYNYAAIALRLAQIEKAIHAAGPPAAAPFAPPAPQASETAWRVVHVSARGDLRWGMHIRAKSSLLTAAQSRHEMRAFYLDAAGARVASEAAMFVPLDHLPGGYVLLPDAPEGATDVDIEGLLALVPAAAARLRSSPRMRVHIARN